MHTSCLNSKCVENKLEIATITDVRGGGGKGIQGRAAECLSFHRLVVVLGLQLKVGNLFLFTDGDPRRPATATMGRKGGQQVQLATYFLLIFRKLCMVQVKWFVI